MRCRRGSRVIVKKCQHLRGIVDLSVEPPRFKCVKLGSCVLSDCKTCELFSDTGLTIIQPTTIEEPFHEIQPPPQPAKKCQYLGEEIGSHKCQLCGSGGVPIKLYQCQLHGECTRQPWRANQPDPCCLTCLDGPFTDT